MVMSTWYPETLLTSGLHKRCHKQPTKLNCRLTASSLIADDDESG